MDQKTPIITLDMNQVSANLARLDVLIKNAPEKFLGIAFDLNVTGGVWRLQKYKPGSIFKKTSDILILASKRDQPHTRLVFGLSYKRDAVKTTKNSNLDDGVLTSFYLETSQKGTLQFAFSENVISVYERGRKDVINVVWEDKTFELKKILNKAEKTPIKLLDEEFNSDFSSNLLPSSTKSQQVGTPQTANMLQTDIFAFNEDISQIYLALGIGLTLIIIISAIIFFLRYRPIRLRRIKK